MIVRGFLVTSKHNKSYPLFAETFVTVDRMDLYHGASATNDCRNVHSL